MAFIKRADITWTEAKVQRKLFDWLDSKGHQLVCPNSGVFGWEADLVGLTQSGMAYEYEVKICKFDFRSDAGKVRKHKSMVKGRCFQGIELPGPSRFFYAVPAGLLDDVAIPEHAGLIEVFPGNRMPLIRLPAPQLHKLPMPQHHRDFLARGLMLRYWKKIHDKESI